MFFCKWVFFQVKFCYNVNYIEYEFYVEVYNYEDLEKNFKSQFCFFNNYSLKGNVGVKERLN